jgi:hypothetical protein
LNKQADINSPSSTVNLAPAPISSVVTGKVVILVFMAFMVQLEAKKVMAIEDPLAREEPLFFPPVLHMGKLIPSDLDPHG